MPPSDSTKGERLTLPSYGPNAVSRWSEVAANTINGTGAAAVTPQEKSPVFSLDMAATHIAVYDAPIAIAGAHKPSLAAMRRLCCRVQADPRRGTATNFAARTAPRSRRRASAPSHRDRPRRGVGDQDRAVGDEPGVPAEVTT